VENRIRSRGADPLGPTGLTELLRVTGVSVGIGVYNLWIDL
jgi:hypothetical protein